jgi:class 3 adenylate cyclase
VDYSRRANTLLQSKEYDKARACADSSINDKASKNDPETWYVRGFVYKTIYKNKETSNIQSPARITALQSFEKSIKLDKGPENSKRNKDNIKYLASTIYNDVIKNIDNINLDLAISNFETFKKYAAMADTSKAALTNNDITFKFALASAYEKLFKKSATIDLKSKYFNLANEQYDEILSEKKDANATLKKATLMAEAAVFQIDVSQQQFKHEIDQKSTTISKLDKDNQLKQLQLQEKEAEIKKSEAENTAKTTAIALLQKEQELKDSKLHQQKIVLASVIGGFAVMFLFSLVIFRQRNRIAKEKSRSDELLLNILPEEVAEELKKTGSAKAKHYTHVSVLFTDFVGFTVISENLSPEDLVQEIHVCFTAFDKIIERNHLEKIKTIGDAYLAVCGMPNPDENHAKNTVQAALEIMEFINKRNALGGKFTIRIGINSGPVVAGIVGVKKFAYDIWGDAVNTAARMEQTSIHGKINISGATHDLIKDDYICTYRGKVDAKNKGEIDMYFVEGKIDKSQTLAG